MTGLRRFEGRVAIVTGSSSGIGEATARLLDELGAHVVVNSSSSRQAGLDVAASLDSGLYVQADVSDAVQSAALVEETIARFGRLDVLINNAGFTQVIPHHDLDGVSDELFRQILEVNVIGPFRLTKLALPHLRRDGGGSVVNVSSVAGIRPTGSCIPYAASKAALNHLTQLLANVSGPEVRINAVAPGLVRTPWTDGWGPIHDAMDTLAPLGRSGTPAEIASVIVDVCESTYLTGQVVLVDGGMSLR
ncbi:MAG: SDR family oxidoreductase [Acidimicrobiales bacterium]